MPPPSIGRYEVLRVLGTGGFATVYLARDDRLEADVAVKVLADNWSQDLDVTRRFVEEARLMRRCDDDRVVRVHTIEQLDDGRPYFVMDYADRGTLADRMDARVAGGRAFGVGEALDLARELAECLVVVHDCGVVHRDLKPSNVLFKSVRGGAAETMIVADFGLARQLLLARGRTIAAGTPDYAAPEQADPTLAGTVDARADVYGAAVILYELLAGTLPFDYASLRQAAAHPAEAPDLRRVRPDVPSSLAQVVRTAMSTHPGDRYPDGRAWRDALWLSEDPAPPPPPALPISEAPTMVSPVSPLRADQASIPAPPAPVSPPAAPPPVPVVPPAPMPPPAAAPPAPEDDLTLSGTAEPVAGGMEEAGEHEPWPPPPQPSPLPAAPPTEPPPTEPPPPRSPLSPPPRSDDVQAGPTLPKHQPGRRWWPALVAALAAVVVVAVVVAVVRHRHSASPPSTTSPTSTASSVVSGWFAGASQPGCRAAPANEQPPGATAAILCTTGSVTTVYCRMSSAAAASNYLVLLHSTHKEAVLRDWSGRRGVSGQALSFTSDHGPAIAWTYTASPYLGIAEGGTRGRLDAWWLLGRAVRPGAA